MADLLGGREPTPQLKAKLRSFFPVALGGAVGMGQDAPEKLGALVAGSRGNRVGCEGGKSPFIGVSFEPKHERPWVVTRGKRASFTTGAEAAEHSDKAAAAAAVAKAKAGKKASAPRLNFQPRRNRSSSSRGTSRGSGSGNGSGSGAGSGMRRRRCKEGKCRRNGGKCSRGKFAACIQAGYLHQCSGRHGRHKSSYGTASYWAPPEVGRICIWVCTAVSAFAPALPHLHCRACTTVSAFAPALP